MNSINRKHKGKHRKCRVPACHLPDSAGLTPDIDWHRGPNVPPPGQLDIIRHCGGKPHICGRPNTIQLFPEPIQFTYTTGNLCPNCHTNHHFTDDRERCTAPP
jgi:hypothetical protein